MIDVAKSGLPGAKTRVSGSATPGASPRSAATAWILEWSNAAAIWRVPAPLLQLQFAMRRQAHPARRPYGERARHRLPQHQMF